MSDLTATVASIMPVSQPAMAAARARQVILTKPLGALGLLEDISVRLAGIFDTDRPDPQGQQPPSRALTTVSPRTGCRSTPAT